MVKSNRESGAGRYDIAMYPKNKVFHGIVIEIKNTKDRNVNLEELADRALDQIDTKNYAKDLKYYGMKEVVCFGIAFRGKETVVKTR